jgi:hypothetical protein
MKTIGFVAFLDRLSVKANGRVQLGFENAILDGNRSVGLPDFLPIFTQRIQRTQSPITGMVEINNSTRRAIKDRVE